MKFLFIVQIIISLIGLLYGKHSLRGHPDPSYNPIRSHWISGPKVDLPIQHSKKFNNNNKILLDHHNYKDVTRALQRKALHKKH